jgi:hypothetical protein
MANNSVGVNSSPNIINVEIPAPDPTTPIVEQDKTEISNELITDSSSGLLVSSVTGSVAVENLESGPEDFTLDDEENFEEPFAEEAYEDLEPVDEIPPPPSPNAQPTPSPGGKDLSKYTQLGPYKNNANALVVKCVLVGPPMAFDNKPVKIELMSDFLNMYEACLSEIGKKIKINSGYRHGFDSVVHNGVKIAQSQKDLREEKIIIKGKYKEPWLLETTEIATGKKITNLNGSTYFDPPTAPAGYSAHGDGLALDLNTGKIKFNKETGKITSDDLDRPLYEWIINNSWRYGFIRTEPTEEWHYEYWPIQGGKYPSSPYEKVPKTNPKWYNQNQKFDNLKLFNPLL